MLQSYRLLLTLYSSIPVSTASGNRLTLRIVLLTKMLMMREKTKRRDESAVLGSARVSLFTGKIGTGRTVGGSEQDDRTSRFNCLFTADVSVKPGVVRAIHNHLALSIHNIKQGRFVLGH